MLARFWGAHLSLRDVLAGQMDHHYFPVELDQLAARITYEDLCEGTCDIGGGADTDSADESSFADARILHRSGRAVHVLPVPNM
jgi:hypothetical protein